MTGWSYRALVFIMARPLRIGYPEAFYRVMNRMIEARRVTMLYIDVSLSQEEMGKKKVDKHVESLSDKFQETFNGKFCYDGE